LDKAEFVKDVMKTLLLRGESKMPRARHWDGTIFESNIFVPEARNILFQEIPRPRIPSAEEDSHNDFYENEEDEEEGVELNDDNYSDEDDNSPVFHDYSYKPSPNFLDISKSGAISTSRYYHKFCYGIELEVEAHHDQNLRRIFDGLRYVKNIYFKEDSSLRNGIEIVSDPMTWEYLKSNNPYDKIFDLRSKGLHSYLSGRCGLHIHTPKKFWSELQIYKVMILFSMYPTYILKMSQRNSESLDRWATIQYSRGRIKSWSKWKGHHYNFRHTAINLSQEHTIEFRIFRGNLIPERFWCAIEFVRAIWEWSANVSIREIQLNSFLDYVNKNRKTFGNLCNFSNAEGYY
jgi:hypothetical protein